MIVEIEDRLYKKIDEWCKSIPMDTPTYINNVLRNKIDLDMYGDLNEKLNTKKITKHNDDIVTTEVKINEVTNVVENVETLTPSINDDDNFMDDEHKSKQRIIKRRTIKTK